jgi:excisionase family DNA binding protein
MTAPLTIGKRGLLSTTEVAAKLCVHRSTVWGWVRSGALRARRLGRKRNFYGIRRDDMERFAQLWLRAKETHD